MKKQFPISNLTLTAGDLAEIQRTAAEIPVEGDRYPAHLQKMVGI